MFDRKSGGADLVLDGAIKPIIVFNHELKKYILVKLSLIKYVVIFLFQYEKKSILDYISDL